MTSSERFSGPQRQRSIKDRLKDGLSSWQTKSRSVDQSLAAAFDVDVIGGLSRLAGSALGSSIETGPGIPARATSPLGERRSSGSGSSSKLTEETIPYTVKSSDTLTSVAARFDTTPSELVSLNKLNSRLIFPGQVLQVPRKDVDPANDSALETTSITLNVSSSSLSEPPRESGAITTSPGDKSDEHALLDSLRPPGSPRFSRLDLSFNISASGTVPEVALESDAWSEEQFADMEFVDIEAERIKDRNAYEKFLKIHVRHITDGQGVIAGVLLVTPNTIMFDPNVSDPLVIEHGPEAYGVIAPIEYVVNAAMFPDIAHMRHQEDSQLPQDTLKDTIYYPSGCPLHKKYSLLKKKLEEHTARSAAIASCQQTASDQDLAARLLEAALEEGLEGTINFGENNATGEKSERPASPFAVVNPVIVGQAANPDDVQAKEIVVMEVSGETSDTADNNIAAAPIEDVTVRNQSSGVVTESNRESMQPNLATVVECDPNRHVIRLEVKAEQQATTVAGTDLGLPEASSTPESKDMGNLVSSPERNPFNSPVIGTSATSSLEQDEVDQGGPIPAQDELFKSISTCEPDAVKSPGTIGFDKALCDAQQTESEYRMRHFSAGATTFAQTGVRSRAFRLPRYSGSDPTSNEPTSSSPPVVPSSPETRGQRMLKRLSYPLVWMGESLSNEPKEGVPVSTAGENPNQESVFSKVFSSSLRNIVDFSSGLFSQTDEDCSKIRDVRDYDPSSTSNKNTVPAEPLGDDSRRLSTDNNSVKVETKRTANLFKGKEQQHIGGQPKLGYRSMVSVDDVPELFASLDKLIPKPAQPCEDPPLYLRLRMGKPKNKKAAMTTTIMSYGRKKMRPEYWFSIPRDKADSLCRFFLLWSPDVYGALCQEDLESRGVELITLETDWEEPNQVRPQATKKLKKKKNRKEFDGLDLDDDEEDSLGATAELAKESWEIVSFNEEVRRALYGSSLASLDFDSYLPDLIGHSEILTDEYRKQLAKHLPARVEGYAWTLVFSTSQHGFSLNSLYRKMAGIESPILMVIEDTQGNVFGALTSSEIRLSELFYGTGESFLFLFNPKLHVYSWTGENSYFIKGNSESIAIGAGDGKFGLWLDGDLNQGRSQPCKTFGNDPLSPCEDFWVKALECWAFM